MNPDTQTASGATASPQASSSLHLSLQLYSDICLEIAPRIIGFEDKTPESPTYGCFDRLFWDYQILDFPNARFQECVQFLAWLYAFDHPKNQFFQKKKLVEWVKAGIHYWTTIQKPDGSFDEYWPFERSFVATCFSLHSTTDACLTLGIDPPEKAIRKACRWVHQNENMLVLNQMAGAAAALLTSAVLLNDDKIKTWAEQKIDTLLNHQEDEGYFIEYGGYDIGYLTINLSYLAKCHSVLKDPRIEAAIKKAFDFLDDKINDNGTYDYKATSRNTQYLYPFSFNYFNEERLLLKHHTGLKQNAIINPLWLDDRFCVPVAIDYLQTACFIQQV